MCPLLLACDCRKIRGGGALTGANNSAPSASEWKRRYCKRKSVSIVPCRGHSITRVIASTHSFVNDDCYFALNLTSFYYPFTDLVSFIIVCAPFRSTISRLDTAENRARGAEARVKDLESQLLAAKNTIVPAIGQHSKPLVLPLVTNTTARPLAAPPLGVGNVSANEEKEFGFYQALHTMAEDMRGQTRARCEKWREKLAQGTQREPKAGSPKRLFLTAVVIFRY